MKSSDVLTLLNAGFTREEILAMDAEPEAASASDHSSDLLSADTPSVSPSSQPDEAVSSSPAVEQETVQDPTQQILQQPAKIDLNSVFLGIFLWDSIFIFHNYSSSSCS